MPDVVISNRERNGYLETIGRKSGLPRETEIWFAVEGSRIYILSGYHNNKDWVKNFLANPNVRFRIGERWHRGAIHFVERDDPAEAHARRLLVGKYYGLSSDEDGLNEWGRSGSIVVIDVEE